MIGTNPRKYFPQKVIVKSEPAFVASRGQSQYYNPQLDTVLMSFLVSIAVRKKYFGMVENSMSALDLL